MTDDSDLLSPDELSAFLDTYLKADAQSGKRNFDPVDDFARFTALALELSGVQQLPGSIEIDSLAIHAKGVELGRAMIWFVADYLHAINPTLSAQAWAQLYHAVLLARHGRGKLVRIKKRPKLAKMIDATRMPLEAWQAKYQQSRAHYYDLRKQAHEIKLEAARKSRRKE